MKGILPSFFRFKSCNDLIRIGKDFDGGYLCSLSDVQKSDLLISIGIKHDWSFEQCFLLKNKVKSYSYDASINSKYFFKLFLNSLIRLDKPKIAIRYLIKYISYKNFFTSQQYHIEKFVGLRCSDKKYISFKDCIKNTNHKNIFLKIDIEGEEYRILDDLIFFKNKLTGLVIEFHNVDLNLNKIKNFIKKIKINLVHVHANNYAPVLNNKLPLVLELTFSKNGKLLNKALLPHQLDQPNNKNKAEINLAFEK